MTFLRIVDPTTGEVGLSFEFTPKTGSGVVINGFQGSQVAYITENEDEMFLYFVKVDDFQTGTAPVILDDDGNPKKFESPVQL